MMGGCSGLTDRRVVVFKSHGGRSGARSRDYTIFTFGVKDLFETWLEGHHNKKKKVLSRIRDVRNGP